MLRKTVPNLLTLCNLLCGCFSVTCTFSGNTEVAAFFILIAAVFDLLDGMAARLLHVQSKIGKELDSLADVVSFGVAPAMIAYDMVAAFLPCYWAYGVFIMPLAAAWRLAKYNVDQQQQYYFKGMPTPANALFWGALAFSWMKDGVLPHAFLLLVLAWAMAFLMVCDIRMFSFKIKDFSWQTQKTIYVYIVVVLLLFTLRGFLGLAASVVLYPVFSRMHFFILDKKNEKPNIS